MLTRLQGCAVLVKTARMCSLVSSFVISLLQNRLSHDIALIIIEVNTQDVGIYSICANASDIECQK